MITGMSVIGSKCGCSCTTVSVCTEIELPKDRMSLCGVSFPRHTFLRLMYKCGSCSQKQTAAWPRSLILPMETVHSYSACIKVVTDGSDVCWAEKRVLYGGLILCHGRAGMPREVLSGPCGAICDYEVEMEAIRMAIAEIGTRMNEGSKGKPTSFLLLVRF